MVFSYQLSLLLVAQALAPAVTDYLIAAHRSVEPGHQIMLDFLGLKPLLNFQMRLGEGTGAALGLTLLEAGVRVYREMATFGEAGAVPVGVASMLLVMCWKAPK